MVYFSFGTKSVYPILTDLLDVGLESFFNLLLTMCFLLIRCFKQPPEV